jgi:hypothetical protein
LRDFDRRFREYVVWIIEFGGDAAGGLLLEWKPDSVYIHELVSVTLSVVPANPRAKQLYERLGFQVTAFEAPFFRMRHSSRLGHA